MEKFRILFVCHGNICRSPMAEFIFRDMTEKAGLSDRFEIASAATTAEEIGNPVYPPARRKLREHCIDCTGKAARRITEKDYGHYDLIIGMDSENMIDLQRFFSGDPERKLRRLLDFADRSGESVADPWYTGDFDAAWRDICEGCEALLASLK